MGTSRRWSGVEWTRKGQARLAVGWPGLTTVRKKKSTNRDWEVLSQVNKGVAQDQSKTPGRSNPPKLGRCSAQCDACAMMALGLLSLICDAACA